MDSPLLLCQDRLIILLYRARRFGQKPAIKLPKQKRTGLAIEDLMMQARMIKYDVIGLAGTRRSHTENAVYDTGEELFLGTCGSRGVGGVGVLVNTNMPKNIDSSHL
ncbi:hypothetical protein RB195_021454 [Necator americanus]|uniref:Uncharacterized protein n=1 Tax=Necator americanus TaxID=51031 RepID=A0ABR1EBD3_NECAM